MQFVMNKCFLNPKKNLALIRLEASYSNNQLKSCSQVKRQFLKLTCNLLTV